MNAPFLVTMTGPNDATDPLALAELSAEFPFVEWGILVSASQEGSARFPSRDWIHQLQRVAGVSQMNMCMHVCGRWVRKILIGEWEVPFDLEAGFQRMQLNFHDERVSYAAPMLADLLQRLAVESVIFQIDQTDGNKVMDDALMRGVNAVPLFDTSGGAGILRESWPKPMTRGALGAFVSHGYAGGLGPQNLATELPKIAVAAGDVPYWIDMETRVRSHDDQVFDLAKVRACLEIARKFMRANAAPEVESA